MAPPSATEIVIETAYAYSSALSLAVFLLSYFIRRFASKIQIAFWRARLPLAGIAQILSVASGLCRILFSVRHLFEQSRTHLDYNVPHMSITEWSHYVNGFFGVITPTVLAITLWELSVGRPFPRSPLDLVAVELSASCMKHIRRVIHLMGKVFSNATPRKSPSAKDHQADRGSPQLEPDTTPMMTGPDGYSSIPSSPRTPPSNDPTGVARNEWPWDFSKWQ